MPPGPISREAKEINEMKKETAFFKRKDVMNAKVFIQLMRSLGYTDEQIKAEMLKIKQEADKKAQS